MARDRPLRHSLGSQSRSSGSLGPWDLVSEIGRGSFGLVYGGRHNQSGQLAAIKVIRPGGQLDPRDVRRFQREIALLSRLDHRNIVRVLDSGVTGGSPWVALELVEGRPLDEFRATGGSTAVPGELRADAFVKILAGVARGVGGAHRAQVVHRDLKPANVIVETATGEPKVLDFGLAFDARLDASRLSKTGEIAGTPAYMAPEVLRGAGPDEERRRDDPRCDVYALGVMLHERLAGEHPFAKAAFTAMEVLDRVLKGAPPLAGRRGIDAELARICDRACALDPAKRPPDGDALALELETWLARRSARPARRSLRLPLALALVLVLVLGLALLTLVLLAPRTPPPLPAPLPARPVPPRPPPPPPPPPPPRLAPEAEIAALEDAMGPALQGQGSMQDLFARGIELSHRFPDDPRARFFAAVDHASVAGQELEARRELVKLYRVRPALPWRTLEIVSIMFRTMGFDRAACCVGEEVYPDDRERPLLLTNFQFHYHLLADDPVRDPLRAEHLVEVVLGQKTDADRNVYPERHLLLMARASALVGQGETERAARCLEEAADEPTGPGAVLRQEAAATRKGEKPRELMGQHFVASFGTTRFLGTLNGLEHRALDPDPGDSIRGLVTLGDRMAEAGQPEHAAIARMRAARFLRRGGHPAEARAVLAKAVSVPIDAIDTRSLVERAFAHELLVDEPVDARRALDLALDAAAKAPGDDPRTPCEVADAWALVARARLALGDEAGAREAHASALELNPRDRRELDEIAARLRRAR